MLFMTGSCMPAGAFEARRCFLDHPCVVAFLRALGLRRVCSCAPIGGAADESQPRLPVALCSLTEVLSSQAPPPPAHLRRRSR